MKGAKESKKRTVLLAVAFASLGLLLTFLFKGEQADEGVGAQVLQKEAAPATEEPGLVELGGLPVAPKTKRVRAVEDSGVLVFEPEVKKKKTGTVLIAAHDPEGSDVVFSLALAKIDEVRGELRVYSRPHTVRSPWESAELSPGLWRVCAFQLVERQEGFPFLLEETSTDVLVREGEATEIGLNFSRDPAPVGALEGAILFSGVPPQVPNKRRSRRRPYREPKTVVGLWNERGKLVDTVDVRSGYAGFSFSQLPSGDHAVGVMWACDEILGWPSEEAQSVSAPSLQLVLSAKVRETFSKVAFLSEDPVRALPLKIYVTTVVDGKVAGGEQTLDGGDHSLHTPPLDEHEVQWLVRAQGYKTELISEERLLFFREEPAVPLSLEKGRSLTAIAVPCSLAELLVYDDPAFLLASCGGLEGVELRRRGASLGATGVAGVIVFSGFSRAALATVRPSSQRLLVLDELHTPLIKKLNGLYVMPLAPR